MKFCTANGQKLNGGERTISGKSGFKHIVGGVQQEALLNFGAEFYEADIKVDAILSYPWMVGTKIGIFPTKNIEH